MTKSLKLQVHSAPGACDAAVAGAVLLGFILSRERAAMVVAKSQLHFDSRSLQKCWDQRSSQHQAPFVPSVAGKLKVTILNITSHVNNFEKVQLCVSELVENLQETLHVWEKHHSIYIHIYIYMN